MIEDSLRRFLSNLWLGDFPLSSETDLLACVTHVDPFELLESSGLAKVGSPLDTLELLKIVESSGLFKLGIPLDSLERLKMVDFEDTLELV